MEKIRCLIIGGGPAGYTAAVYASRSSLAPVLYEGMEPGGQLTTTTVVENYPGFKDGVDANELMNQMRAQAQRFGADIRRGTVTKADLSQRPFQITVDGEHEIEAETLIIATGATDHRHGRYGQIPGASVGNPVPWGGRIGLCHLRRLFLSPQRCGGRGRRRFRL